MSTTFPEDLEYDEAFDDAEAYDDSEAYDDAESAASRARRRRARALSIARRRATNRRAGALSTTAPPRAVVSAVKDLDLQTQVQEDNLRSVVAAQNRKLDRSNFATVATLLIGEAFRSFGEPDNAFLRAGIQASPLLLLSGGRGRGGVEGVLRQPAVYGGAGMLGLAFLGQQRQRGTTVTSVSFLGPTQLVTGRQDVVLVEAFDAHGRSVTLVPTWSTSKKEIVDIDPATGSMTAGQQPGVAVITMTAGDVVRRFRLEVVADLSANQATASTTKS